MEGTPDRAALTATQTATEAARDVIAEARTKRDELLVLASHDIRNAVGIVDSALTMLDDATDGGAQMRGMMRRATHRMGILVRAMVDVDLLQRELMPLTPAEVRWSTVVVPVIDGALEVAETKEIAVVPKGDLEVRLACDAALVQRTVAALVDHAIGNAPQKSVVEVEGERLGEHRFAVRVRHMGRAVVGDTLDRYFTTLPLRFSKLAAMRHGGAVRAVSPIVDGAGFAFDLEIAA